MSDTGNPLLNQPPTTVNVGDVASQEVDTRNDQKLRELGKQDAGSFAALWAAYHASRGDGASTAISGIIGDVVKILALCLQFMTAAQGQNSEGFWKMAAAVLTDLTGVEFDATKLSQAAFGGGVIAASQELGGDLLKLLATEFAPTDGNLEKGDIAPAEKFLGFLLNFAIRQGNVTTICTVAETLGIHLEGLREYGEIMGKNLGLSRLARRGLQPLIQILVALPLTWFLNAQYRPTRLAKEAAIKKFFRDSQFETQMRTELGQEGFSDDRINDLIADARPLLEDRQIVDLLFRFNQDAASVKLALTQRGWGADESQQLIDLQRPLLERGEIAHLWARGTISKDDALGYLGKLGYDAATADLVLQAHVASTVHVPVIHFGELRRLLNENVIDVLEFQDRLTAQGYNTDDVNLLTLDALNGAKGKQKILGLAEIKAGFKAGIILGPQAIADLEKLGYSKDDASLIVATFPTGKKAGSTPPTTGG